MADSIYHRVTGLESFTDPDAAAARIAAIYDEGVGRIRRAFDGSDPGPGGADGRYPFVGISVGVANLDTDARLSYGVLLDPGVYGTTLTRPDVFGDYYREQIALLMANHRVPVVVGISDRVIPLPFVVENSTADVTEAQVRALQARFRLPDLWSIDDGIANGTARPVEGEPKPLALFTAERVDFSLHRLTHYTATSPRHFQRFVLLTNYQRYVDEFRKLAHAEMIDGTEYEAFVEPGDVHLSNSQLSDAGTVGTPPVHLPQMPAYHLVGPNREGITLVNIGVGPSNAKTITDHLAVLRPHCWLMLGHCAGLRRTTLLGDYILAHAYVRDDHVLDRDLPVWVPVPPIAEVQVALQDAVGAVTGLSGIDLRTRMRTGTVATTDNRNWELRVDELFQRLGQSRAIAIDMESATVAANGFRFRVPYGSLLCVSDKPFHGEIKLKGMANAVYRERITQHLLIGIAALRSLRERGIERLHSRKLRSFDEPAFR
jgi:AMP nucleosidase